MPRFIYGLDPASQDDFFGIVVHRLDDIDPREPNKHKLPHLQTLRRLKLRYISLKEGENSALGILQKDLFPRYPPSYLVIDYTMERTFAQLVERIYGKAMVETILFSVPNKNMLKHDGMAIFESGYRLPDPQGVKHPQLKEWLQRLETELKHEEMIITKTGKITFDHPRGEKNDLAIAWELSIHGCLRFLGMGVSTPVGYAQKRATLKDRFGGTNVEFTDEFGNRQSADLLGELKGKNVRNVNIQRAPRRF